MTAAERKEQTENLLAERDIPVFDYLPVIEEELNVQLKTAREIAERILVLAYMNCIVYDPSLKNSIVEFLINEDFWGKISAEEKELLHKPVMTEDDLAKIASRGECIWFLLWTINKADILEFPFKEIEVNEIFASLPPFMKSTADFINGVSIKPMPEIMDQADLIFRLYWAVSQTPEESLHNLKLHPRVVYERYFAVNWVVGFRKSWDDTL